MSYKYAKAYKEVLEIIKHFPEDEYNKIPKEKINFFEKNADKNYNFIINPNIDLDKQNISKEADAIIIDIFLNYFATENQKDKINKILEYNEYKLEEEKREKYKPDNIFKNIKEPICKEEKNISSMIEVKKEKWYQKIFKLIKNLFKRK
jgi:hypothetical protein